MCLKCLHDMRQNAADLRDAYCQRHAHTHPVWMGILAGVTTLSVTALVLLIRSHCRAELRALSTCRERCMDAVEDAAQEMRECRCESEEQQTQE